MLVEMLSGRRVSVIDLCSLIYQEGLPMKALIIQLGLLLLLAASHGAAQTATPAEPQPDTQPTRSAEELKAQLYERFVSNRLESPAVAYEAGKEFIQRYEAVDGPDDQYVAYLRKWVAAYEKLSQETGRFRPNEISRRVYSAKEVEVKARLLFKPEPLYTSEARIKDIHGVVTLEAILRADGRITGIKAINGLPAGLTEKAIEAARLITFIPAMKDGLPVSQSIKLKYAFNLN
jgi:TonB family protein